VSRLARVVLLILSLRLLFHHPKLNRANMKEPELGSPPMAAMISPLPPASPNRRRRVRHKIQTPAYASFSAQSNGVTLDLHEIVDISEDGAAIQCHSPLDLKMRLNLCLDLADCAEPIFTTGQVVWLNTSGRAGLRFSGLSPDSISRLREWLFVNVMAGVAHGEVDLSAGPFAGSHTSGSHPGVAPLPNYTDTLAAVSAVQSQVEALGPDLAGALQLIAERAQTLVRASGAAIALAAADPAFMVCGASSGSDAPPVGARLQIGEGFSGECIKTGALLRCDDTELDSRVDRENCRALGLRSILAVPLRAAEKSVGLLEVFSAQPHAFSETDSGVLQRLGETVLAAVNRAARAEDLPPLETSAPAPAERFAPTPGSVLFASAPEEKKETENADEKSSGGISLPRSPLIILVVALAMIFLALGYNLAPWIQTKLKERGRNPIESPSQSSIQTVLASSQPPMSPGTMSPSTMSPSTMSPSTAPSIPSTPAIETATLEQLRQMADNNNPAAENALGLRYATGDGVKLDETEAVLWFTRAAEQGNVAAQSKLGALYYSGRGVRQDYTQAYFWMLLARASGDATSKALAPSVTARLTRAQSTSIEQQADAWLQQHLTNWKPAAGH
jgi:putative methionine-R-sulfoxide reductase with GAF domain